MNKKTLRRLLACVCAGCYIMGTIGFCRSDEVTVSFDQLWPQGRVAQVLQLSKQLIRCSDVIKSGVLSPHDRAQKVSELARLTKEFGDRLCHLDYEGLNEDEYLYIYTVAKQALALHALLQDSV